MVAAVFIYFLTRFFEVEILGMGPLITVLSQVEKTPVLEIPLYNLAEISHHTFGFWIIGTPADSSLGRVFQNVNGFSSIKSAICKLFLLCRFLGGIENHSSAYYQLNYFSEFFIS